MNRSFRPIVRLACPVLAVAFAFGAAARADEALLPSDEQVRTFAEDLERRMKAAEPGVLAKAIDLESLLDDAFGGLDLPVEITRNILQSDFLQRFEQKIAAAIAGGGSYRIHRFVRVGDQLEPRFRLTSDEGINYHQHKLRLDNAGNVRIVDMDVVVSGEPLSATLRRSILPAAAHFNRNLFQRLAGAESSFIKHMDTVNRMMDLARDGQFERAIAVYHGLPPELRNDQNILLMRVLWTGRLEDDEPYLDAINEFRKLYPDRPNIALLEIDYYLLREEWDKAMASIDAVDKALGGDPFLDQFRGTIWASRGEPAKAEALFNKVIAWDKTMQESYWSMLDLALAAGDHAKVTHWLIAAHRDAGIRFIDLREADGYADYVASGQYPRWRAYLEQAEPDAAPAGGRDKPDE